MFEKFKFNRTAETPVHDVIVPVEGLEDKTFSLPEPGNREDPVGIHKDDWIITDEVADDSGNINLTLSRYKEDGGIETRQNIPADVFTNYQVDVDAERRVRATREDPAVTIGVSAVRMSLVDMVRAVRNDPKNDKFRGLEAMEQKLVHELRADSDSRLSESLGRIEQQRTAQRRENPVKSLQRGDHHKGRR